MQRVAEVGKHTGVARTVCVQEGDELAGAASEPFLDSRAVAAVLLEDDHADRRLASRDALRNLDGPVGRAVADHRDLDVTYVPGPTDVVSCIETALDRALDALFLVERRDHDAQGR